jgi:hypothetical protein
MPYGSEFSCRNENRNHRISKHVQRNRFIVRGILFTQITRAWHPLQSHHPNGLLRILIPALPNLYFVFGRSVSPARAFQHIHLQGAGIRH